MSNCWCSADVVMVPGGRCGFHTNQMRMSAITASGSQIRKIRIP